MESKLTVKIPAVVSPIRNCMMIITEMCLEEIVLARVSLAVTWGNLEN